MWAARLIRRGTNNSKSRVFSFQAKTKAKPKFEIRDAAGAMPVVAVIGAGSSTERSIAALNFAWQQARELYADEHLEADGSKLYRLHGTLFFASTTPFLNQFDPANDPQRVTLDCRHLSFVDYSAIAALKTLRERAEALPRAGNCRSAPGPPPLPRRAPRRPGL